MSIGYISTARKRHLTRHTADSTANVGPGTLRIKPHHDKFTGTV
jgi:hypothetical protein